MAQKLKEDVRKRIEDAALDTLLEKGVSDCDMRTIAKRASVTPGNLYRYFKNKDDIIQTLLSPIINALNNIIGEETAGLLSLNSPEIKLPLPTTGQSPTDYLQTLIEKPLTNAIIQLGALGRKQKKLMKILLDNSFMENEMHTWLMSIIINALNRCFVAVDFDKEQAKIMIKVFTLSFCEGVVQLLKSNLQVDEKDYECIVHCYIYMKLNGLSALIKQQLEIGSMQANPEVFINEN